MPANFLQADISFPRIDEKQSTDDKINTLVSYVYMLQEQLRYSFGNINKDNFNEAGLNELEHLITDPVYMKLSDTEGNITELSASVAGMSLNVENGNSSSTIQLMKDGIAISSQAITLTGVVTFQDLSTAGNTQINGANITTGTISSRTLYACTISGGTINGTTGNFAGNLTGNLISVGGGYGTLYAGTNRSGTTALEVYGSNGLRLTSADDTNIYISNGDGFIMLLDDNCSVRADLYPANDNNRNLGLAENRWADIYAVNSNISSSDERQKKNINPDISDYDDFFDAITPVSYMFKDGHRTHIGFISQAIESALYDSGLSSEDFAGFIRSPADDDGIYGLRYGEFIALNTHQIQMLKARVKHLEELLEEVTNEQ